MKMENSVLDSKIFLKSREGLLEHSFFSLEKPQTHFEDLIDNSDIPFIPKIEHSQFSKISKMILNTPKPEDKNPSEDLSSFCSYSFPHPYETEISNLEFPSELLKLLDLLSEDEKNSKESSEYSYIDSETSLKEVIRKLKSENIFSFSLKTHEFRSYQGFITLLIISTFSHSFIIDALALRSQISQLNSIFLNNNCIKIINEGSHSQKQRIKGMNYVHSVASLQRNCGIYITNLFSLPQMIQEYNLQQVDFVEDLFGIDWRVRPISKEIMINLAQENMKILNQFLIYKQCLITKGGKEEYKNTAFFLEKVFQKGKLLALQKYSKPSLSFYLQELDKEFDEYTKFNTHEQKLLRELVEWRDNISRNEDESLLYVMPNSILTSIVKNKPMTGHSLIQCCTKYIPPFIFKEKTAIFSLITTTIKNIGRCNEEKENSLIQTNICTPVMNSDFERNRNAPNVSGSIKRNLFQERDQNRIHCMPSQNSQYSLNSANFRSPNSSLPFPAFNIAQNNQIPLINSLQQNKFHPLSEEQKSGCFHREEIVKFNNLVESKGDEEKENKGTERKGDIFSEVDWSQESQFNKTNNEEGYDKTPYRQYNQILSKTVLTPSIFNHSTPSEGSGNSASNKKSESESKTRPNQIAKELCLDILNACRDDKENQSEKEKLVLRLDNIKLQSSPLIEEDSSPQKTNSPPNDSNLLLSVPNDLKEIFQISNRNRKLNKKKKKEKLTKIKCGSCDNLLKFITSEDDIGLKGSSNSSSNLENSRKFEDLSSGKRKESVSEFMKKVGWLNTGRLCKNRESRYEESYERATPNGNYNTFARNWNYSSMQHEPEGPNTLNTLNTLNPLNPLNTLNTLSSMNTMNMQHLNCKSPFAPLQAHSRAYQNPNTLTQQHNYTHIQTQPNHQHSSNSIISIFTLIYYFLIHFISLFLLFLFLFFSLCTCLFICDFFLFYQFSF
jgi:ribonuclease D